MLNHKQANKVIFVHHQPQFLLGQQVTTGENMKIIVIYSCSFIVIVFLVSSRMSITTWLKISDPKSKVNK